MMHLKDGMRLIILIYGDETLIQMPLNSDHAQHDTMYHHLQNGEIYTLHGVQHIQQIVVQVIKKPDLPQHLIYLWLDIVLFGIVI